MGRGFVVYVKRLWFNYRDRMWHEGLSLEAPPPSKEVHRSIHLTNNRVRPHQTSDLIIELPNREHSVTPGEFSRDWCFDPPGAVVV